MKESCAGERIRPGQFSYISTVNMQNDTPTNIFCSSHHCKFTENEWTKSTDFSSTLGAVLEASKLTNKIHPLFDNPLRQAVPDFSVVEQSARLATHFIECGSLDRIFIAISNKGKPGRSWQDKKTKWRVGLEIPQEELTKTKRTDGRRAQDLLIHLSNSISFALDTMVEEHGITESIPNKKHVDSKFPHGEKSKVKIAASLYHDLENAQGTEDTPYLLNLQVDLAITLVHEIGHAIDNQAHGKWWHGHFLGENIIREVGFDVETRLFGGHLTTLFGGKTDPNAFSRYYHNRQRSALKGILVLWEYPYQSLATAYAGKESHMEIRKQPKDVRSLDVAWRVPVTFLGQLFQDSFWKDEVPSDPSALRPECSVGYTFRADQDANSTPVNKHKDDRIMMYVPRGYRRIKHDGSIVLDEPSNDEVACATNFWECITKIYSSNDRRWKVIPDGSENTHLVCAEYMDDIDSDTEMVGP
jgi:hypothetical protein